MLALALAAAVLADSVLVRTGLATLLSSSPELEVARVGSAADAGDLGAVDVVVHDVPDGVTAEEAFSSTPPNLPVLAVVGDSARARELLRAGAMGVVQRSAPAELLSAASVAVASGLVALDPECLRAVLAPASPEAGLLSARERQVLDLVADGLSNKLIAERLGMSEHTAKFHVRSLFDKLGADTRAEAVARAIRRGLLAL